MSILGVGLLGGSLGLAARTVFPDCQIVGYGHRKTTLDRARELGAIDIGYDNPSDAVRDADLVILCTPVGRLASLLHEVANSLRPGALITDVGSTKRQVVTSARSALPDSVHFVGSHPIAGSEKRGVEHARADLFQNALCILTPAPDTHPQALANVEQFWRNIGMRTRQVSPEAHDRMLAFVSHLPHALMAALVSAQPDDALDIAGRGFLDATRIASGDGALWRDILLENADNLKLTFAAVREQLACIEQMLDAPEGTVRLEEWLNAAAERREALLQRKQRLAQGRQPPAQDR